MSTIVQIDGAWRPRWYPRHRAIHHPDAEGCGLCRSWFGLDPYTDRCMDVVVIPHTGAAIQCSREPHEDFDHAIQRGSVIRAGRIAEPDPGDGLPELERHRIVQVALRGARPRLGRNDGTLEIMDGLRPLDDYYGSMN